MGGPSSGTITRRVHEAAEGRVECCVRHLGPQGGPWGDGSVTVHLEAHDLRIRQPQVSPGCHQVGGWRIVVERCLGRVHDVQVRAVTAREIEQQVGALGRGQGEARGQVEGSRLPEQPGVGTDDVRVRAGQRLPMAVEDVQPVGPGVRRVVQTESDHARPDPQVRPQRAVHGGQRAEELRGVGSVLVQEADVTVGLLDQVAVGDHQHRFTGRRARGQPEFPLSR